ncbi:uncharacterized protein LOC106636476 [Copidosoma floridanum]|uniref:uncharacterized protein LOC106636476 n=1 Tax=Copidosoma floridanum TaxID=29053 RepID=UPI000C6F5942|nr:uncharacterized protein LOC106636476 [Copidosoma floridanum]
MSGNNSKAVSFTNGYCTLADGLASGLEDCLAENVVLDWFGKTIKSKSNVAAFMNTHKVNSKHVFSKISSTSNIGYNKKLRVRSRRRSVNTSNLSVVSSRNISIELRPTYNSTPKTPTIGTVSAGDRSRSLLKKDAEESNIEENDLTCELRDDDFSKIFKIEKIQSTNIREIEQKLNQISLEDKQKMIPLRKMDSKETNESTNQSGKGSLMNYVEAHGEILFSKKSRRISGLGEKQIMSSSITHTWRKPCKLQIAYTSHQESAKQTSPTINNKFTSSFSRYSGSSKLLNFKETSEIRNFLMSKDNHFDRFLDNFRVDKKEDNFFKYLGEHLSKNEANKLGLVSRYVDDQLVFHKIMRDDDNDVQSDFLFNHTIHVIIYEGRSRCRINLSQKFS